MAVGRGDQLRTMFDYLDSAGVNGRTAEAHLVLGNFDQMTVRCGGPGIHSWPAVPPFETFEVLTAGEPPRFWRRYGDTAGVVFAGVPRLLVAHHITKSGGIQGVTLESSVREVRKTLTVRMAVRPGIAESVEAALAAITGVDVISSRFSPV